MESFSIGRLLNADSVFPGPSITCPLPLLDLRQRRLRRRITGSSLVIRGHQPLVQPLGQNGDIVGVN